MSHSKHRSRMLSVRDLEEGLVALVKAKVSENSESELLHLLRVWRRALQHMSEKGGYTLVTEGQSDITIYKNI